MSLIAAALVLVGASAPAQETDQILRTYTECAVRRSSDRMRAMLNAWDEGAYRTAAEQVSANPRCTPNDNVTTVVLTSSYNQNRGKLRGMAAESLLKRSDTVARLAPQPKAATYSAAWTAVTGRVRAVDEMAMCVAATDPAGILALLATSPNSTRQRQAFAALSPSLETCLAKGYQLDTKPAALRAALAEALYHRDTASAGGSVKGS
jgi:hypothetical protein